MWSAHDPLSPGSSASPSSLPISPTTLPIVESTTVPRIFNIDIAGGSASGPFFTPCYLHHPVLTSHHPRYRYRVGTLASLAHEFPLNSKPIDTTAPWLTALERLACTSGSTDTGQNSCSSPKAGHLPGSPIWVKSTIFHLVAQSKSPGVIFHASPCLLSTSFYNSLVQTSPFLPYDQIFIYCSGLLTDLLCPPLPLPGILCTAARAIVLQWKSEHVTLLLKIRPWRLPALRKPWSPC